MDLSKIQYNITHLTIRTGGAESRVTSYTFGSQSGNCGVVSSFIRKIYAKQNSTADDLHHLDVNIITMLIYV